MAQRRLSILARMQNQPVGPRISSATDVLIGLLPVSATLARYLPSGALMPFRLVALALIGTALLQFWDERRTPARGVFLGVAGVGSCFIGFGAVAVLRFGLGSIDDAAQVMLVIAATGAVAVLVRRRRTLIALLAGWLISALGSAVVGVWEITTGNHLPLNGPASMHAGVIPGWNYIAAFFDNPNLYAYHCALSFLLLPALFVVLPKPWRWACIPAAVLFLVLLAWTGGRIAVLGLAVGTLAWAARHRLSRRLALIGTTLLVLLTWVGAPGFGRVSEVVTNLLVEATEQGASVWVRIQLVRSAWWMAQQSNFLGVGPGGFGRWALRPDNPFPWESLSNAHWGVSEVIAEYGAITLGALIVAMVVAAVLAWRRSIRWPGLAWGLDRVFLFVPVPLVIAWPFLSASHSSWLRQPLSALHIITLVAFLAWGEVQVAESGPESTPTSQDGPGSPSAGLKEEEPN